MSALSSKRKEESEIIESAKKHLQKVERIIDQKKVRKFEKMIPKVLKMAELSCVNVVAETTDTLKGHIRLSTRFFQIFQEHRTTFSEMLISAEDVSFHVKNNQLEIIIVTGNMTFLLNLTKQSMRVQLKISVKESSSNSR